jgi:hypothetical protein
MPYTGASTGNKKLLVGLRRNQNLHTGLANRLDEAIARELALAAARPVSALVYAGLALSAAGLILGSASQGNGTPDNWTALLLSWPLGRVLVVGVGIAAIGLGLVSSIRLTTPGSLSTSSSARWGETATEWTERWGRLGTAAWGIVFGLVRTFLIRAALEYDPQGARGLGGALQTLTRQPLGPWLLGAVALGLVSYRLFMLSVARCRHIHTGRVR